MPRTFNRKISFNIQGEIYDLGTSAESIIKNYEWSFRDNCDGNIFIVGHHKDYRGKITNMVKLSKIEKYGKPDTDFFVKM